MCNAINVGLWMLVLGAAGAAAPEPPFLGQGELVGEVTCSRAILRARLTLRDQPNAQPLARAPAQAAPLDERSLPEDLPGAEGQVRIRYGAQELLGDAVVTEWRDVDESSNFSAQFALEPLKPDTRYYYQAECRAKGASGGPVRQGPVGQFVTAPEPGAAAPVTFCVITGQAMRSRDVETPGEPRGFRSYLSMARLRPAFLVSTGDSVYYDQDGPIPATNERLARYHWDRLYGLPSVRALFRIASGYWEKDDHDYRWNDCCPQDTIPGPHGSSITDALGQRLFREAVPMGEKTYRSFVWGQGLQLWLVEGRDFRSPNALPDGPRKTLWGAPQIAWLKHTLQQSPCRYKILISPTPLVGPDRSNKRDNHVNPKGFRTEGREFLRWVAESGISGFYVVCGDRHWQYYSVDPETGVKEFCSGPISHVHAGGSPGNDPAYHRYHNVVGGFLSVSVTPRGADWQIAFRHHDPDGRVLHEALDP